MTESESFSVSPTHTWLFGVMVMTPDWESVRYEFKYSHLYFWKERPSLISLILNSKQDCIPVGYILAARWPYLPVCSAGGGGCLPGSRGVPCLVGVPAWSRGWLLPGGACLVPGGCLVPGRGCLPGLGVPAWSRGGDPSMHWSRLPLWTESQTPVKI